jgi:diadenylate cyclase
MALADFLSRSRIYSLKKKTKEEAIRELVYATCQTVPEIDADKAFEAVWQRESVVSSWVAPSIAIPHARLSKVRGFVVAVGRSKEGIQYESIDGKPVHLLVLILGGARQADRHILLLAEVARILRNDSTKEQLLQAPSKKEIYRILHQQATLPEATAAELALDMSHLMILHAYALAEEVEAKAVILHIDPLESLTLVKELNPEVRTILMSQNKDGLPQDQQLPFKLIRVPFPGLNRSNQLDLTLLLALSQGLISRQDRVVCLFGVPESRSLDSLIVIDVSQEIPSLLPSASADILGDVSPSALERVLQIATALSREGREGKAVGTLFVLGDYLKVRELSHQLVINPFKGYREDERSILDPSLEETIKEFSTLDGAFLIRGDGIIEAAGVFLRWGKSIPALPSGLGARHTAAANITAQTDAISVAVSQSTGRVSLFKQGKLILILDKPKG